MVTTHKLDASWQAEFKGKWRKAVLYDHDITAGHKAVALATLEDYNRTDPERVGTAWNKAGTLEEKTGISKSTILRAWVALRDAGYLHSLGRTSHGRGVYIHRFDLPPESCDVKLTSQCSQNDIAVMSNWQLEQGDLNKGTDQEESYIGSCPAGHDPASFDDDPIDISFFIEEEEPQRREELINYWATVATAHECQHTYTTALALFIDEMKSKNRTHWGGTFMSAMKTFADPTCETPEFDIWDPDALLDMPEPEHTAKDLQAGWAGRDDRPQEFRKAWERALLAGHDPHHVIAVGASTHSRNIYPRELNAVIDSLSRADLAKLAAKFRIENL